MTDLREIIRPMRYTNKVALVTGGAKGIGEAAAKAFSAEGAAVVIADVDEAAGAALALSLPKATFVKTDVTKMQDAQRAVQAAVETYGGSGRAVQQRRHPDLWPHRRHH